MPETRIDQICAHSFLKATAEFNFCPIRFNNFGALQCYPNYIQFSLFGHELATDLWGSGPSGRANYLSAGAQMNVQMVFFTHMKTVISIGYARAWGNNESEKNYYEQQANTLLTIWGGPVLNDYANRMWGGLVKDY